jgi:hypothetical protein
MELPLTYKWLLWHDSNWIDLKQVQAFDSVITFWQLFNAVPPTLPHLHNLRLFRYSIHPSREDPQHAQGGKWIIQLPVTMKSYDIWMRLVLDVVGSTIPRMETITGLEVNTRRRGDRISVWTNTSVDQLELGEYLRTVTGHAVDFKEHHEIVEQKSAFLVKSLFQLKT